MERKIIACTLDQSTITEILEDFGNNGVCFLIQVLTIWAQHGNGYIYNEGSIRSLDFQPTAEYLKEHPGGRPGAEKREIPLFLAQEAARVKQLDLLLAMFNFYKNAPLANKARLIELCISYYKLIGRDTGFIESLRGS